VYSRNNLKPDRNVVNTAILHPDQLLLRRGITCIGGYNQRGQNKNSIANERARINTESERQFAAECPGRDQAVVKDEVLNRISRVSAMRDFKFQIRV
jgi:hypothetical protein